MIIDCVSDLHGEYPTLEGGDLLIVAGDLTGSDKMIQYGHFGAWMDRQNYKKKVLIGGNHDNYLERKGFEFIKDVYDSINVEYLCDSGCEYEGLKIWGSPWTAQFPGINPHCCAFTVNYGCDTDDWLNEYWEQIPKDTDVLITHCPPYGILDGTRRGEHVGSGCLLNKVIEIEPKLHVFGHIHEWGGKTIEPAKGTYFPDYYDRCETIFVNASVMNEDYDMVNKPVRIIL